MEVDSNQSAGRTGPSTAAPAGPQASATGLEPSDPLWDNDPWVRKAPRPVQRKWEDLCIQPEVPFLGSDGKPMQQTHRLQLGPKRGGIVMLTKSFISEVSKQISSHDLAILLPVTDHIHLAYLAAKLEGPYEV